MKSRRDAGQGHGVYIGRLLGPGQTKNEERGQILQNLLPKIPIEWVVQPIYEESLFYNSGWSSKGIELRNIVNTFDGHAYAIDAVYVRNASGLTAIWVGRIKRRWSFGTIQPILILNQSNVFCWMKPTKG